jgi:hypothetical protein
LTHAEVGSCRWAGRSGTASRKPMLHKVVKEGVEEIEDNAGVHRPYKMIGLDALLLIGGDGSPIPVGSSPSGVNVRQCRRRSTTTSAGRI